MTEVLKSGDLERHIFHNLQPLYARRYHTMLSAIETHLVMLGVRTTQSARHLAGGFFLWLHLPDPLRADVVAARAAEHGLIIGPGSLFGVHNDEQAVDLAGKVRVCFAWEAEDLLEEGIIRLGRVIRRLQAESSNDQGVTHTHRLAIRISMDEQAWMGGSTFSESWTESAR